jgi:hypothetical protein
MKRVKPTYLINGTIFEGEEEIILELKEILNSSTAFA